MKQVKHSREFLQRYTKKTGATHVAPVFCAMVSLFPNVLMFAIVRQRFLLCFSLALLLFGC